MKQLTGLLKLLVANLAGVIISLANQARNAFPTWRVGPLCYATLPGRILRAINLAVHNKSIRMTAGWNVKLDKKLTDSAKANATLIGNVGHGTMLVKIFMAQPVLIFIKRIFSIVTIDIDIPSVLALIPDNSIATSTLTRWGGLTRGRNVLDWFTWPAIDGGILRGSKFSKSGTKCSLNGGAGYSKHFTNTLAPNPLAVFVGSCIESYNLVNVTVKEFFVRATFRHSGYS
jgi:hypothetical protein